MTRITTASTDTEILRVLHETADAVYGVLSTNTDWGPSGQRATQYAVDLRADAAALEVLHAAGIAVMSEESGRTGEWNDDSIIVVMDPLDGSTNASRRVPWYAKQRRANAVRRSQDVPPFVAVDEYSCR